LAPPSGAWQWGAAHRLVARCFTLPLHVAAGLGGNIKNTIGRLDQVRRFKFTQEVVGADKVDTFIDDHPPTHDVAVLKQGAENSIQHFEGRGLTKPAGRTPLLQPALLIDPNFRRRDVYLVEVRVDPF
jgi:hypothetical protein